MSADDSPSLLFIMVQCLRAAAIASFNGDKEIPAIRPDGDGHINPTGEYYAGLDELLNFVPIDDSWFVSQGFMFDDGSLSVIPPGL